MLARVPSLALFGVDAISVSVEADVVDMPPEAPSVWTIVGLGDAAIKEARERIRAALKNSGHAIGSKRVTVNLAPADLRKEGSHLDLPMALSTLLATGRLRPAIRNFGAVGELGLDGTIPRLAGVLAMAVGARSAGLDYLLVPAENADEAAIVEGLRVVPVATLAEACDFVAGRVEIAAPVPADPRDEQVLAEDFSDVRGQESAKRALEIAAAGGHNVLFVGPPGSGKTMLARRFAGILPPLSFDEALEVTKIHSIAGALAPRSGMVRARPFRSPHHTASAVALVGGGTIPRPGEISLAHHGVLFLDELPEFSRATLEVLRQPLEDGTVVIARAAQSVRFPARLVLIAAMNPCPCGYATHPGKKCTCTPMDRQKYLSKISGPLLDRIDMHVDVAAVTVEELQARPRGESTVSIAARVRAARERQAARFAGRQPRIHCNAHMTVRDIDEHCVLTAEGRQIMERAMRALGLSARAHHRILKVARTVADLSGSEAIGPPHVSEAVGYRNLDRMGLT